MTVSSSLVFFTGDSGRSHPISDVRVHGLPGALWFGTDNPLSVLQPEVGRIVPGARHYVQLWHLHGLSVLYWSAEGKYFKEHIIFGNCFPSVVLLFCKARLAVRYSKLSWACMKNPDTQMLMGKINIIVPGLVCLFRTNYEPLPNYTEGK